MVGRGSREQVVGLDVLMSLAMVAESTGSNRERRCRGGGDKGSSRMEKKGLGVVAAGSDTGSSELLIVVILSLKN